jgi:ABC-type lipoprotein export system ATPase subunit
MTERPGILAMPDLHISAVAVEKAYRKGAHLVPVLHGVDISARKGEFLSIVGQSGSGKSTLLHLVGLLDGPDEGEIILEGQRIDDLPARTRDELRNRVFGFVFQFYHLLPELNVRLMPKLAKLKPGSRIISDEFDMKGAKPKEVVHLDQRQNNDNVYSQNTLYKWVVPWETE